MKCCRQLPYGLCRLALVLALLGGCQQLPHGPASFSLPSFAGEKGSHLSPSQVADIQIGMAKSLEKRGEIAQAMTAYSEALTKDPKRADAYVRLAVLADGQGKFTDAVQWYHKSLELQPNNANIYCNLGYSLYLQERWGEAETNLRKAIELAPDHQRAHNNLGSVLAQTDRPNEALVEFRKGGCSRAGAHINLAFGLALHGSLPAARHHYELALKQDPSSVPAKKGLQEIRALIARSGSTHPQLTRRNDPVPTAPGFSQEGKAIEARGVVAEDTAERTHLTARPAPQNPPRSTADSPTPRPAPHWTPRPTLPTAVGVEIICPDPPPPIPIWTKALPACEPFPGAGSR
jgi:Flp pilus assembly protein TadD